MKLCASCGAGLPDGVTFCNICGSKEFKAMVMPDLDAPEPEKPRIEYDQYGRPIGQQYEQPQYEQPHFAEDYTESYGQGYSDQSGQPPYLDDYAQQYQQQYAAQQYQQQYAAQQYAQQYQQQYGQQYPQQYQQYPQQYDQQYQQQYGQPYPQQYEQPYPQQYEQPQAQSYPQQYEQPQAQSYPQQYEQPQVQSYPQQYEQPQVQPVPEPVPEPAQAPVSAAEPEPPKPEPVFEPEPPKAEPAPPPAPEFDSKSFVFEKKEESDEEQQVKPRPKNAKEFIAELQNTRDFTNNYNAQDFAAHKKECIFAALGITFWVPYAFCKDSKSSRFYANQGLLTLIIEVLFSLLYSVFANIISIGFVENTFDGYRLSFLGWIVGFIVTVVIYAIPAFIVVTSIMNVRAGKIKEIPFIGKLRLIS